MSGDKDAFISYGHADADWVRVLAENLHRAGVDLWFDEWEITPGDVLVHKLDEGVLSGRAGILVVSPVSLGRPVVREEYAAMWTRAVAGQQRLIPVLYQDVELPPMLASRVWVDFRGADGPAYDAKVAELVRALKGGRKGPPPRGGPLQPPPGTGFRAEGPISASLSISATSADLAVGDERVTGPVEGVDHRLDELLWQQQRALTARDGLLLRGEGGPAVEAVLADLGLHLGQRFLPEPVTVRLQAAVAEATRLNVPLELGISVADGKLADLPWELLRLPPGIDLPLALHPRVDLYRLVPAGGAAPALSIPPPLRVLVAIGSPEAQNARGELLDMEAELARILDATEPARRQGKAAVRILENGGVDAIRAALDQERWHVLYISCHAAPGVLILEDGDGREDRVSAERLWGEALPAQRGVPLVVLAGCSTGRGGETGDAGKTELPGIARALAAKGVPAVLAMQGSVSDPYATALAGELFEALGSWPEPLPLRALGAARRDLETARQRETRASPPPLPEWPLPALYALNRAPGTLYDPKAPAEPVSAPPEPKLDDGVVVRRIGDLVGRRREQRLTLKALRDRNRAGVVLHGIGGVGKSTLAAQIMHRMAEGGALLVSLAGPVTPERVLGEVGSRLQAWAFARGHDEGHPLRRLALDLRDASVEWEERFKLLDEHILGRVPFILLLDNFEDNLDSERRVALPLGDLLARWAKRPEDSRLLFTSRHPFKLPKGRERAFESIHLGPLSPAETRKLVLRLPGLATLDRAELQRAHAAVGGHPRALEYLDAILRGGQGRFDDVEERLEAALAKRGVTDPRRWYTGKDGDLDQALAETVTLAADDVLLGDLLARLEAEPLARELLVGASVYREPVDDVGLLWQVSEEMEQPPDPAREERLKRFAEAISKAEAEGRPADPDALGLSAEALEQLARDLAAQHAPPLQPQERLAAASLLLEDLSLLAPVRHSDDDSPRWLVHRWTANALAQRFPAERVASAHRRAGRYWGWRVKTQPQSKHQDLLDCLEARFHHHAAGEIDAAFEFASHACLQLETWGAWREAERLIEEMLGWFSPDAGPLAACIGQLGNLAYRRGDFGQALARCREVLPILERLGNKKGVATTQHQLGMVAQDRGEYDRALDWYRRSLAIEEQLGDRAGTAKIYHQLGMVAQLRGDHDRALDWYRRSLAIAEQLGDRAGMASSYGQLGLFHTDLGRAEEGLPWTLRGLALHLELGAPQAGLGLRSLARQREAVGARRFEELLGQHLDAESTTAVLGMLAQAAEEPAPVSAPQKSRSWLGRLFGRRSAAG